MKTKPGITYDVVDEFLSKQLKMRWKPAPYPGSQRGDSISYAHASYTTHTFFNGNGFMRLWRWCVEQTWWPDFWWEIVWKNEEDWQRYIDPETFAYAVYHYINKTQTENK